ncbi:MAG TPA: hypothetical protein VHF91_06285 [Acidimicrobiales bacterium]|nr:hypothetical protein [Acidimicrobiales bacterium]
MVDEETVDAHLGEVIDKVISAIQETKQAVWSASTTERRQALNELKGFLGEQLAALSYAEERINGRARNIVTPTGHAIRNLRSEAGGEFEAFRSLVLGELRSVAADARRRAQQISGAPEAGLLVTLADGIDHRVHALSEP